MSIDASLQGHRGTDSRRFVPCASIPDAPWHCVYTRPHQEAATEARVRQEGAAAWLPLEAVALANRQTRIRPIFPRYLFVQDYRWMVVRNAGGEEMASVLRSPAGMPLVVPPRVVATLMAQRGADGIIRPAEPREVDRGDEVEITGGPFASFRGVCSRTARDRVWVLLNVLGSSQIEFKRTAVALVHPHP